MSKNLVILGPPGAGKGTQAARIADHLGIPAISTGDIFRANVKGGTPLGRQVKALIEAGEFVPDSLTNALVRDRLGQPDAASGFLLDGYPRTPGQVTELDAILESDGRRLDAVIELVVDVDAVVERLLHRAQIEGRADDTEPVIRRRLEVYAAETEPLASTYRERGLLSQIDGLGTIDDVTARALEVLSP